MCVKVAIHLSGMGAAGSVRRTVRAEVAKIHEKLLNREVSIEEPLATVQESVYFQKRYKSLFVSHFNTRSLGHQSFFLHSLNNYSLIFRSLL